MKNSALVVLAICFTWSGSPLAAQGPGQFFSPDQLDNLLAPVALYPDPLLAQVLTAATYVDQVEAASRMLHGRTEPRRIDSQPWDVSVKSVAHYPGVLRMMSEKPDWTAAVGQAYINQPSDVMAGIQRLRMMARNQGNLVSNRQQEVIVNGGYISIDPFQAQYLYVPVYNPGYIYYRRGNFLSFGAGFAIGAWLNYDFNWGNHGIFYHGWGGGEGGWVGRSRGFVGVNNNVYVNNNFSTIQVNRAVVNRNVNYGTLNRYNSVHNTANYNNIAASHAGSNRVLNTNNAKPAADRGRPAETNPPRTAARQQPVRTAASNSSARSNDKPSAMDPRTNSQRNAASRAQAKPVQRAPEQPAQRQSQQAQRQSPQKQPQQQAQRQPQQKQPQVQKPPQQHAQNKPPPHPEHPEKP
jgi:hypothetical protein